MTKPFLFFRGQTAFMLVSALLLASCGGSDSLQVPNLTGEIRVSLSDPPTCEAPAGNFTNVWVTVTKVRVHVSNSATPDDSGWVDLVDRTEDPIQVDLLGDPTNCILASLGATMGLPAGSYQQLRLHLLSNSPAQGVAVPAANNCGVQGFNCARLTDGSVVQLDLSSQDETGIKVPSGRLAGGGLTLEAGQTADINIDFNACASFVMTGGPALNQGPNGIRFKPTLTAGEVSFTNALSGHVVDSIGGAPLVDATIFVFAEQPDENDIDRIIMQTRADATLGTFLFCPLPEGDYDIVVTAQDSSAVTHHPTIVFNVPVGTDLGDITVTAQTAPDTGPVRFEGEVTSTDSASTGTSTNAAMAALQAATPEGGAERLVTIPPLGDSTVVVATENGACPAGTNCVTYVLIVPAGNPSLGTFDAAGITLAAPAVGDIPYSIEARAFLPGTGHETNCSPSSVIVDTDDAGGTLLALAGQTITAAQIDLIACIAGQ